MTSSQFLFFLLFFTFFFLRCNQKGQDKVIQPDFKLNKIKELTLHSRNSCLVKTFMEYDGMDRKLPSDCSTTSKIAYEQTVEKCKLDNDYVSYNSEFHNSKELSKYTFYLKNEHLIAASLIEISADKQLDLSIYFDKNELPYLYYVNESNFENDTVKTNTYKLSDENLQAYIRAKVLTDYKKTRLEFL